MCNLEVSVWSTKNCRNYRVLNLRYFGKFVQQRKVTRILRRYEDYVVWTLCGYVRATVWKRRCGKTLWERDCEKDVVRKTLWERRFEKDVVRKSLWERYFFLPASYNRQIFVITNVLRRLWALHLWCLCYNNIFKIVYPHILCYFELYGI